MGIDYEAIDLLQYLFENKQLGRQMSEYCYSDWVQKSGIAPRKENIPALMNIITMAKDLSIDHSLAKDCVMQLYQPYNKKRGERL